MSTRTKKRKIVENVNEVRMMPSTVAPISSQRISISDMDNDCIESICDWMPLADLCSFSVTCKRFYKLANQYFHRRYKNHQMEIVNDLSGPRIKTAECYAKCFKSNVSSVRLTSMFWNLKPIHLFTFLHRNCSENLRELEFDTINLKATQQSFGEQIESQLMNLTTISFINCSSYDIYTGFLRFCNHLKHLIVKEDTPIRMHCGWMLHEYSDLESFVYHVPECYNAPPISEFLQLKQHIKKMSCSGDRIVSIIQRTNITLDYLMLRIEHATLFKTAMQMLNSLCKEKRVRRLKLDFGWYVIFSSEMSNQMTALGTLTTLEGLGFATKELNLKSYHPIICRRFKTIRSLRLEVAQPLPEAVFHLLQLTVPNLQEIHLRPWWGTFMVNFRNCVGTLAAGLKHLKTIAIHQIDADVISTNDINQIDIWRNQLTNACLLSIYLPYEVIQTIKFTSPVGSRVVVRAISSLEHDIYSTERRTI